MNKYILHHALGEGAFGKVMLASNKSNGQLSLQRLKHPNIVVLKEVIRENCLLHFVFEYVATNLYTLIMENKLHEEKTIQQIMFQLLQGLEHMHKHGDIKPENILSDGNCFKIADFGLAREIRSCPPYTEYVSTRWYRAPEVLLRSDNYSSPIDIWACGCIFAELYLKKPLFPGTNSIDQLNRICHLLGNPSKNLWNYGILLGTKHKIRFPNVIKTGPTLKELLSSAPEEAIALIQWMLQLDPGKRPTCSQALNHSFFRTGWQKEEEKLEQPAPRKEEITLEGKEARNLTQEGKIAQNSKFRLFKDENMFNKPMNESQQQSLPIDDTDVVEIDLYVSWDNDSLLEEKAGISWKNDSLLEEKEELRKNRVSEDWIPNEERTMTTYVGDRLDNSWDEANAVEKSVSLMETMKNSIYLEQQLHDVKTIHKIQLDNEGKNNVETIHEIRLEKEEKSNVETKNAAPNLNFYADQDAQKNEKWNGCDVDTENGNSRLNVCEAIPSPSLSTQVIWTKQEIKLLCQTVRECRGMENKKKWKHVQNALGNVKSRRECYLKCIELREKQRQRKAKKIASGFGRYQSSLHLQSYETAPTTLQDEVPTNQVHLDTIHQVLNDTRMNTVSFHQMNHLTCNKCNNSITGDNTKNTTTKNNIAKNNTTKNNTTKNNTTKNNTTKNNTTKNNTTKNNTTKNNTTKNNTTKNNTGDIDNYQVNSTNQCSAISINQMTSGIMKEKIHENDKMLSDEELKNKLPKRTMTLPTSTNKSDEIVDHENLTTTSTVQSSTERKNTESFLEHFPAITTRLFPHRTKENSQITIVRKATDESSQAFSSSLFQDMPSPSFNPIQLQPISRVELENSTQPPVMQDTMSTIIDQVTYLWPTDSNEMKLQEISDDDC